MKVFHSEQFVFPLPRGHRFPLQKCTLLRKAVEATGLVAPRDLLVPEPATDEQIQRAHDAVYLEKAKDGRLTAKEIRHIGLPWSPELVVRARHQADTKARTWSASKGPRCARRNLAAQPRLCRSEPGR